MNRTIGQVHRSHDRGVRQRVRRGRSASGRRRRARRGVCIAMASCRHHWRARNRRARPTWHCSSSERVTAHCSGPVVRRDRLSCTRCSDGSRSTIVCPLGLPAGTPLAHKTGDRLHWAHDAGVMTTPRGDVVVVVMSGPWDAPCCDADHPGRGRSDGVRRDRRTRTRGLRSRELTVDGGAALARRVHVDETGLFDAEHVEHASEARGTRRGTR